MTTTKRVHYRLDSESRLAMDSITIQLFELAALAELLQKNSGGLTQESAQALGDLIACISNTVASNTVRPEAGHPIMNELGKLDGVIVPLQKNAGGLSEADARALGRSIARAAKALRTSRVARGAEG